MADILTALHPLEAPGELPDRVFLWAAARALGDGHAVLPLGQPIGPLTFYDPEDVLRALLMPADLVITGDTGWVS